MKSKLLLAIAALVLVSSIGVKLAHASNDTTLKADIPFAFYVANQALPAGTYIVGIDLQTKIVTISDDSGRGQAILIGTVTGDGSDNEDLVFDHVGDQYYFKALNSEDIDLSVPVDENTAKVASAASAQEVRIAMVR